MHLSPEAAALCVQQGVDLVGLDAISIDPLDDSSFRAHHILLNHGILVLEGIDLAGVPAGDYTLICFPLKIAGGEAPPFKVFVR